MTTGRINQVTILYRALAAKQEPVQMLYGTSRSTESVRLFWKIFIQQPLVGFDAHKLLSCTMCFPVLSTTKNTYNMAYAICKVPYSKLIRVFLIDAKSDVKRHRCRSFSLKKRLLLFLVKLLLSSREPKKV